MLRLPLLAAFGGVRGTIEDVTTGRPVPNASLVVTGTHRDGQAFSSPHTPHVGATYGDFYRPLALGSFTVTTTAPGYVPDTQSVQVPPGAPHPRPLPPVTHPAVPSTAGRQCFYQCGSRGRATHVRCSELDHREAPISGGLDRLLIHQAPRPGTQLDV